MLADGLALADRGAARRDRRHRHADRRVHGRPRPGGGRRARQRPGAGSTRSRRRRAPPTSRCGSCRWRRKRYRKLLDSDVADVKNVGGPYGGAITAAVFLSEFVGDVPWAHLDIAGPMKVDADESWRSKGATGFGTRLLIDLAMNFAKPGLAATAAPDAARRPRRRPAPGRRRRSSCGSSRPRSSPAASIAVARAWARARASRWIVVVRPLLVGRLQRRREAQQVALGDRRARAGARPSRRDRRWATPNITQRCSALANGDAIPLVTLRPRAAGGAGDVELVAVGLVVEAGDEAAQQPGRGRAEHASQNCST